MDLLLEEGFTVGFAVGLGVVLLLCVVEAVVLITVAIPFAIQPSVPFAILILYQFPDVASNSYVSPDFAFPKTFPSVEG